VKKYLGVDNLKLIVSVLIGGYFLYCLSDLADWHFIDNFDLIIHEAGHPIMGMFGEFIGILGGSLFQVLVPFVFAGYFFEARDMYSGTVVMTWLGYNLVNISIYIKDSILMQLPLLGGDSVIHDWNYLLTSMNVLKYTYTIAQVVYSIGATILVVSAITAFILSFKSHPKEIQ
jgi:hypothetical protein